MYGWLVWNDVVYVVLYGLFGGFRYGGGLKVDEERNFVVFIKDCVILCILFFD